MALLVLLALLSSPRVGRLPILVAGAPQGQPARGGAGGRRRAGAGLNVVGPSIAGVLLGSGLGTAYLAVLMGASAVAVAGFVSLRRVLAPAIDSPRPAFAG